MSDRTIFSSWVKEKLNNNELEMFDVVADLSATNLIQLLSCLSLKAFSGKLRSNPKHNRGIEISNLCVALDFVKSCVSNQTKFKLQLVPEDILNKSEVHILGYVWEIINLFGEAAGLTRSKWVNCHKEVMRIEAERREAERIEAERIEAERIEAERIKAERIKAERKEAERKEAERIEAERKEAERKEAERKEAERKEAERREVERKEAERKEAERKEAERIEAERIEAERIEAERIEAERKEAERIEAERKEAERKESERKEAVRLEAARLEAVRLEAARSVNQSSIRPVCYKRANCQGWPVDGWYCGCGYFYSGQRRDWSACLPCRGYVFCGWYCACTKQ